MNLQQAEAIIKETRLPVALPVSVFWKERGGGNGGIYLAFAKKERLDVHRDCSWGIHYGSNLVGFSVGRDKDGNQSQSYEYSLVSGESWPLIIHRDFYGVAPQYDELLEEFRMFHNLFHDRPKEMYQIVKQDGSREKAVWKSEDGWYADTALLRQYASVRGLILVLQIDAVQFFDDKQEPKSYSESEDQYVITSHVTNDAAFAEKAAFGRVLGKRFIQPLPIDKCGMWPFETEKKFSEFIIGVNEDGSDHVHSCNPEPLDNNFGKHPGQPHFLTAVFFRTEVLKKYYDNTSVFSVSDGSLQCGGLWNLRMDNDNDDYVVVFLGDLGQMLSYEEQLHWRHHNIRPAGGISKTCFSRSFDAVPANPISAELALKHELPQLLESWKEKFGFSLLLPLHENDQHNYANMRVPFTNDSSDFDRCLMATAKVLVDSLNEADLVKGIEAEVAAWKLKNGSNPPGITKLALWLERRGADQATLDCITAFRIVQTMRSKSAAHRKGESFEELYAGLAGPETESRIVFRERVLKPLLEALRNLKRFADIA